MSLPPIPRELSENTRDIHALFLYLQRLRDGFEDAVESGGGGGGGGGSSYTDEMAQDAVGLIVADTTTINATYNDAIPRFTWDVIAGTSVQLVDIALAGALVGTRPRLNFIPSGYQQLLVTDDPGNARVNIQVRVGESRLIAPTVSVVLPDRQSMVVSRYLDVSGTLELQGDATIEVI